MDRQSNKSNGLALVMLAVAMLIGMTARFGFGQSMPEADAAARDYASATGLLNRGLNEMAVQEYRKFLAAHTDHDKAALARYGLGVALFRLQRLDEAEAELSRLADARDFAFAAEVLLIRGQCLLAGGAGPQKPGDAARMFQQFLDQHADHDRAADAAALLAESLYRAGQYQKVRAPCELLATRWPQNPSRERAEFFNGLAAMALEDFAQAARVFDAMLQAYPQGRFADQVALLLAQSWHHSGDADRAMHQYESVIKQGKGEGVADALYGLATLLQAKSEGQEAGRLLDQLLENFPAHRLTAPARMLLARIWFDAQRYDEALAAFQKAAGEGAPKDEAAYWVAKCQMRRGEFAAAAVTLDQAIRAHPASSLLAEMSYDRAVALTRAGDQDGAATALRAFRDSFPDHPLAPDALYLHATIEHGRQNYAPSHELCRTFLADHSHHALAPAVSFLAAENDLLAGQLEGAVAEYRQFLADYPGDAQAVNASYRLGTALYRLNRFDEAESSLTKVVSGRQTPEPYRRGLFLLGDVCFQRGDWSQAAAHMADYLSFGSDHPPPNADDAMLKLGLAQLRLGRDDEALAAFASLLEGFPKSVHLVQALFERGQILLGRKDFDQATAAFAGVLDEGKESRFAPYAMNHLAAIAMQRGKFDEAADLYRQLAQVAASSELAPEALFQRGQAMMAARQYAPAAEVFALFGREFPSHVRAPQAQAQQAIALARLGAHAEALDVIALLERDGSAKLEDPLRAALKYEQAWCLRNLGRADDAAQAYRDLLGSFGSQPIAANAMLELAELATTAGRHAEADEVLSRLHRAVADAALDIPEDFKQQALYRLAACKFELGRFDESAALCEEFIQDYPRAPNGLLASVHLFCGESYSRAGKSRQAAPHYAAVVEQFPSDPACATSLLRLGECQATAEQWDQSEKSFAAYLKRFGESDVWFQAQFGLGWACENQGRLDEAIAAYRALIDRHNGPTAARAQFQIGECLFAKKQFDDAVRELLKVDILYGYPEWSAAALYEAGRCFEELSKREEACSQFQQVQQKYPQTRWAQLAAQRLSAMTKSSPAESAK